MKIVLLLIISLLSYLNTYACVHGSVDKLFVGEGMIEDRLVLRECLLRKFIPSERSRVEVRKKVKLVFGEKYQAKEGEHERFDVVGISSEKYNHSILLYFIYDDNDMLIDVEVSYAFSKENQPTGQPRHDEAQRAKEE